MDNPVNPLDPLRDSLAVQCPVCGETFDVPVETDVAESDWLEECPRCGAAVNLVIRKDDEGTIVGLEVASDQGLPRT